MRPSWCSPRCVEIPQPSLTSRNEAVGTSPGENAFRRRVASGQAKLPRSPLPFLRRLQEGLDVGRAKQRHSSDDLVLGPIPPSHLQQPLYDVLGESPADFSGRVTYYDRVRPNVFRYN